MKKLLAGSIIVAGFYFLIAGDSADETSIDTEVKDPKTSIKSKVTSSTKEENYSSETKLKKILPTSKKTFDVDAYMDIDAILEELIEKVYYYPANRNAIEMGDHQIAFSKEVYQFLLENFKGDEIKSKQKMIDYYKFVDDLYDNSPFEYTNEEIESIAERSIEYAKIQDEFDKNNPKHMALRAFKEEQDRKNEEIKNYYISKKKNFWGEDRYEKIKKMNQSYLKEVNENSRVKFSFEF